MNIRLLRHERGILRLYCVLSAMWVAWALYSQVQMSKDLAAQLMADAQQDSSECTEIRTAEELAGRGTADNPCSDRYALALDRAYKILARDPITIYRDNLPFTIRRCLFLPWEGGVMLVLLCWVARGFRWPHA